MHEKVRPLLRAYLACTLDGFIAEEDGGVSFLDPYASEAYGYTDFLAQVGTLILGRTTYEQVLTFGQWPYVDKRSFVVTSHKNCPLQPGVELWSAGIDALLEYLSEEPGTGDGWLVGGPKLWEGFGRRDAIDQLELYVIPRLLCKGVPLFRGWGCGTMLQLLESQAFGDGVVKLKYALR